MDAPQLTKTRPRRFRKAMTLPEVLLWQNLKQWRQDGFHIRRQHPIGPYVLDFFCHEQSLAIEVDGAVHSMGQRPQQDSERDE